MVRLVTYHLMMTNQIQEKRREVLTMRTTKKEFKEVVQNYIISNLSDDETTDTKKQLQNGINEFVNWYGKHEQRLHPNKQDAFMHYLMGLPSWINVEFTYYGYDVALKSFFEGAGGSYDILPDEKAQQLYYWLIYRELQSLCKYYDVSFF